ncbi:MAG: ybgR [Chitinophagaceae bacterium]|nr:ybgR [Chitinophagaceae bacterium]
MVNTYLYERKNLKLSLTFVVLLMIWGLVFNELTNSNIVELDASSYVISGIIGLVTIYVSRLQERPGSETHPLGYSGFIPILNLIRNLMIILICIKAIGESVGSIFSGPPAAEHGILFLYSGVTLILNSFCSIYLQRVSVKLNSSLLKTDALEWRIDTISNISIIGAFAFSYALQRNGYGLFSSYVDPVVCIFFSIYMCVNPVRLFVENMQLLSVSSVDKKTQQQLIEQFIAAVPIFSLYATHFTIVNVAGVLWVNFEIEDKIHQPLSIETLIAAADTCQGIMDQVAPKNKLSYHYSE